MTDAINLPNKPRILIVDDNVDAADTLALLFSHFDCDPVVAYSGPDALTRGHDLEPDLILLDIGMPGMDGFETARRVRKTDWGKASRIAALTAWGDDATHQCIVLAGMDAHHVKPLRIEKIADLVESLHASRDG
ncbi:CheY-like chemotaxis protein [Massilia sp. UYP11]|uniref:response regulator n=1 Tax=Massilia sp. UYP11 TaxID=1756385 RepID=UPI003D2480EC